MSWDYFDYYENTESASTQTTEFDLHQDYDGPVGSEEETIDGIVDAINDAELVLPDGSTVEDAHEIAEIGAVVLNDGEGAISVYNETLYSDGYTAQLDIPEDFPEGSFPEAFVHNHTDASGDDLIDAQNRYPSPDDFATLVAAEATYKGIAGENYDPSLIIIDVDGNAREFKWSDRATWAYLSEPQKIEGVNLPDVFRSDNSEDSDSGDDDDFSEDEEDSLNEDHEDDYDDYDDGDDDGGWSISIEESEDEYDDEEEFEY